MNLIDQQRVASGGHADPRDRHGRPGSDGGGRLKQTVHIIFQAASPVFQRCDRALAERIRAQIVRNGQPGERRRAAIDDTDGIGDAGITAVGVGDGGFRHRQNINQFARHDIGAGNRIIIGKGRLIGKGCHVHSSLVF